ncbi:alpha/beta fold hydrolase [Lentzea kentuckyensis]|uniref:alpha/beta fold hydrolase n=1 Tax=Lentzea kentuckyensis TaxID=360086 RepID=UPI000A360C9E|nr:alpha/beta hydrolase [Lentzea kentuckyensis]
MTSDFNPSVDVQVVSVDGLRVHYKRAGQGPAVVLLHGSGSSLEGFERVATLLSASYDVIRPDLPGFGRTGPRPDRDYRVRTYASTIARFTAALQVPHFAVAGNSLGGNIAWNLALDAPERVDGLVLVNATGYPEKSLPAGLRLARNPFLRPVLRRWLPRGATERGLREAVGRNAAIVDDAMVDRVHSLTGLPGNRSAFVDFANTDQPNRSAEIGRITVPTLVLRSTEVDGQHFARDIPCAQERTHPDGGHLLPEEDPDWVAAAIAEFLPVVTETSRSRKEERR